MARILKRFVSVCWSMVQYVAVCCNVVERGAVWCSVVQNGASVVQCGVVGRGY